MTTKRFLSLAIVAFWLVMVGLLVRKQAPADAPAIPAATGTAPARDEWFAVLRDGKRVGHAHRVTSSTETGQRFSEELVFALAMFGEAQRLETTLEAETGAGDALTRFRFRLVSPAATFTAAGTSDGKHLSVAYGPEGQTKEVTLPLTEPIHLPSTLRPRVLAGDLTPGTTYSAPVLNPLTLRGEPLTVTIEGRETVAGPDGPVDAIRIVEEHQGMRAQVWLAADGGVIREQGTLGFTLERESRSRALAGDATLAPVDLVATTRIPLAGRIAEPRETRRLTLRIDGAGAASIPNDPPRQRVAAGRVRIERETVPAGRTLGAVDGDLTGYLTPAPFIESDDAAIVTTARAIVGGERDAATAAHALVDWVHAHLEQAPSVTVPDAKEVLAARRGDCNEHAVLLAALARAAGIPARVVAGAMYLEDGFYYHAWNELWLGAWVSADAVFQQLPTDATHVKMLEGGPERHVALAAVVGRLGFTTEETDR